MNGTVVLPLGVFNWSGYEPALVLGAIVRSTNRYVPASLVLTLEVLIAAVEEITWAANKFWPRTSSLTGLIVWLAHQVGGSTLVTTGPPALIFVLAAPSMAEQDCETSTNARKRISKEGWFTPAQNRSECLGNSGGKPPFLTCSFSSWATFSAKLTKT